MAIITENQLVNSFKLCNHIIHEALINVIPDYVLTVLLIIIIIL